jgi:hypothetical protein
MKYIPDKHHQIAVKFLLQNPGSGLLMDPGLGKTGCVLYTFYLLRKKKLAKKMLVVSKIKVAYNTWPDEIKKWGFPFNSHILHGKGMDVKYLESDAIDIHLINFEGLDWLKNTLLNKKNKHLRNMFDICVIDESTKIKNTNTQRFRTIRSLAPLFKRRHILTGTPTPKSMMDIYGQIWFLDLGHCLGFKTQFRNEFFTPSGFMGYEDKLVEGGEEKIFNKLKHLVIRFKDTGKDMPEVVLIDRKIPMPPKAMRLYKELELEFIAEMESGVVTAVNAAARSSKLRQVTNGSVYGEDKKVHKIHTEKAEELIELVEELNGKPVFVAYEFQHDLDQLKEAFPNAPHIGSGVSEKKAREIIKDWNAGKIPILFGHPDSVAHGLNMQEIDAAVVFFSLTWNLENYQQFIKRIARRGNKAKFTMVYHIIMENTIDELMMARLAQKEKSQKNLLKYFEDYLAKETGMASKAFTDDVENLIKAAVNCKFKLPKWKGDADAFLREWRGSICALKPQGLAEFIKITRKETVKLEKKVPAAKVTDMVEKCIEFYENVFNPTYNEDGTCKYLDEMFAVVYPSTEKEEKEMRDKFSANLNGEKAGMEVVEKKPKKGFGAKVVDKNEAETAVKEATKAPDKRKSKVVKEEPVVSKSQKKRVDAQSSGKTSEKFDKALSMLKSVNGASVKDIAKAIGSSEANVRAMIGSMRAKNIKVKSLGNSVFKV